MITTKELVSYKNGDYSVRIMTDGSKFRSYPKDSDNLKIEFPESIDLKITNKCLNNCLFCHEGSTPSGDHCDYEFLMNLLDEFRSGMEIAIGGGNPLSHPRLKDILIEMRSRSLIANMTINELDLKDLTDDIRSLIFGLGVSYHDGKNLSEYIKSHHDENLVVHCIAGIHPIGLLDTLLSSGIKKILILGYKLTKGRGLKYYTDYEDLIDIKLQRLSRGLPLLLNNHPTSVISFDNLAINQLKVRRLFTSDGWDKFYMGDDFTFSMYIDAVDKKMGPSSTSLLVELDSPIEYFVTHRKDGNSR